MGETTMIFNEDVISRKANALQKMSMSDAGELVATLARLFGEITDAKLVERPWFPGGGSLLLLATIKGKESFIKIKDKSLTVESRLEGEPGFLDCGALANEARFCNLLSGDPRVPRIENYAEDGDYAFAVFERLSPFDEGIAPLDAFERLEAFLDIEALLRKLHGKGIVHTDVHEKNILFRGKQPVLCDFEEARFLVQDVPFEESLDVAGENRFGNVGDFPDGYGLPGLTCLNRLRKVFKPLIKEKLPALLETCHFSNDCAFNVDELQEKDERIYQSVDLGDCQFAGQRPMQDSREGILGRMLEHIGHALRAPLRVVDVGSNLGTLSFAAARNPMVERVTGLEAFANYVKVSRILGFLLDQKKVFFDVNQAGADPLPEGPIDVLMLFSVYHHIRDKDGFLTELRRNRPRTIIAEMAVQERFYKERGGVEAELQYMGTFLGYSTLQVLGMTADYGRPICLFSDLPPIPQGEADLIMAGAKPAPAAAPPPVSIREQEKREAPKQSYPVKVSIVLPTYNHIQFLPKALASLFAQTFADYELIVVNDGSTDQTAAFLSKVQHPKMRVITQENKGLPAALNRGFEEARGQYWTWTSADNVVGPTWIEELVKALEESPPGTGYALSHYAVINENDQIVGVEKGQCFETQHWLRSAGNASFLYRADIAKKAGLYDASLTGAEDLDMWLRMSLLTRGVLVESVLYYYRIHGDTMTAKIPGKVAVATRGVVDKFLASCGGKIDVDRVFPGIAESQNPALSRWQAKVWLSARLFACPYWPVAPIAEMLISAMAEHYDQALVGNAVSLFVNKELWDEATAFLSAVSQKDRSDYVQNLVELARRKDRDALAKVPFITLPDDALGFDMRKQLSRKGMAG